MMATSNWLRFGAGSGIAFTTAFLISSFQNQTNTIQSIFVNEQPHIKILRETSRVRVLDQRFFPGSTVQIKHMFPTVRWQVLDASEPTPAPTFHLPGSTTTCTSKTDKERRDIVFELLTKPKYTEKEVKRLLQAPGISTNVGNELMLEVSIPLVFFERNK